jgi:hypothetical protein
VKASLLPGRMCIESIKFYLCENYYALYESDDQVLCFAAGQVSQLSKNAVTDLPWSKSFIMKAVKSKCSIVPVYISTLNRPSFYRYQKLRFFIKKLTGVSIERFFILRAQYYLRNNSICLNFGKPIPHTIFDDRFSAEVWAQKVRAHVYRMGSDGDPVFDTEIPVQSSDQ